MIQFIGGLLFVIGLGGVGAACDGQGSFMASAVIFAFGIAICLVNTTKGGCRR